VISCTEAVERLWLLLEDQVPEPDREAVEEHLAFCRRCCGEVEFAERLRTILAAAAEVEVPPDVEARLFGALDDPGAAEQRTADAPLVGDPDGGATS
jgi:anti-sigma factor (TIGR02949 family)